MRTGSNGRSYGAPAGGVRRAILIAAGILVMGSALTFLLFRFYRDNTGDRAYHTALEADARGDTRSADLAFEAAARLGLDTPEFLTDYGRFELKLERYPQAEALFRRALQRDLSHGSAHAGLGDLYMQRGEWELAAQEFAFAAESLPERSAALFTDAGYIYMGLENLPKAREFFRRALEADSTFERAAIGLEELMRAE